MDQEHAGLTSQELLARFRSKTGNSAASLDDMFNSMLGARATYVSSAPMLVAELLANYPAGIGYLGYYARVTDLYGKVDDIMRCRYDGTRYNWVPQREAFSGNFPATEGTVAIIPLVTPPTLKMTATALTNNLAVTPDPTNAYIGERHRIIMPSAINLGLFTAQITGLVGSNLTLLAGSVREIEFGSSGWFQSQ